MDDIETCRITVEARLLENPLLRQVRARDEEPGLVAAARNRNAMLLQETRLGHQIHPVRVGGAGLGQTREVGL